MVEATLPGSAASSGAADDYGGFWIRSLAYSADFSIITIALIVAAVPFAFLGSAAISIFGVIATVAPWAYFVWFAASEQQATYGKQLCGLKIEHAGTGARISLLRSLGRELAKIVSSIVFFVGFLMIGFTSRKQGLHDMLATTVVARTGNSRIVLAIIVTIAGILIPVVVIPLMFGALFASMMMMLMGAMMGGATMGGEEMKQLKPVPRIEQPARRLEPVAPPRQSPAPKPSITAPATLSTAPPDTKPAAEAPPKPQPIAPLAIESPPAPAPMKPRPAAQRAEPSTRVAPAAPAMRAREAATPCVYKPVMTDEDLARCR